MTDPSDIRPPERRPGLDDLEASLAALGREPVPDDGFCDAVLARLDHDAADEAARAARWLERLQADRRREARVRRYGLAGVAAGIAGIAAGAGAGLAAGPAAWTPLAVFALGLTTAVSAWLVAGRSG